MDAFIFQLKRGRFDFLYAIDRHPNHITQFWVSSVFSKISTCIESAHTAAENVEALRFRVDVLDRQTGSQIRARRRICGCAFCRM